MRDEKEGATNLSSGGVMNTSERDREAGASEVPPHPSSLIPHPSLEAWEQIENGRYRPRRIRGSCLGRELG
jgi:hypothetical protein